MRSLTFSKKGQTVQGLPTIIMALVFAAVILVMGLVITQSLQDTTTGSQTATAVTNESVTFTTPATSSVIVNHALCGFGGWNATAIMNDTTNATLVEGVDYTINSAAGTVTNLTPVASPALISYTSTWGGEACDSANGTVVGLGSFADFWEIIVLAIVIALVIGVLLVVFGGGRRER